MITTIIKRFLIACYYRFVSILRLLKFKLKEKITQLHSAIKKKQLKNKLNKLEKDKSMPYGKKKGRPLKSTPVKKVKKKSKKKS